MFEPTPRLKGEALAGATAEGVAQGSIDGPEVGRRVEIGSDEGAVEGEALGIIDGPEVGRRVVIGSYEGAVEGEALGTIDGPDDGRVDGVDVKGNRVGSSVLRGVVDGAVES